MTATELIENLQKLVEEHGDKEIWFHDVNEYVYRIMLSGYNKKDDDFYIIS